MRAAILVLSLLLASPTLSFVQLSLASQGPESIARFYTKINTKRDLQDAIADGFRPTSYEEGLQHAGDYELMFGAFADPSHITNLKTRKPSLTVLLYELPAARKKVRDDFQTANSHEDWFLHGTAGQRIQNDSGQMLMDMGNAQFRAHEVEMIVGKMTNTPFDGIYLDMVNPSWVQSREWSPAVPRAAIDAWPADMLAFLEALRARLPAGKRLFWNSLRTQETEGRQWASWEQKALTIADGVQMDGFCKNRQRQLSDKDFLYQLHRFTEVAGAGKTMLTKATVKEQERDSVAAEIDRVEVFCFAAYLLVADGRRILYRPAHLLNKGRISGIALYEINLGVPLRSFTPAGQLYRRSFARGEVLVNPTSTRASLELGTPWISALSGQSMSTAVLDANSAMILLKP